MVVQSIKFVTLIFFFFFSLQIKLGFALPI
jgi:hypothetical protein